MELPGMKGFSETSLKNMRKFYENWVMLDPNPSVVTDESPKSTFTNVETPSSKSTIMIADLQSKGNQAFTNSAIVIAELKDEPTLKSRICVKEGAHYPLPYAGEGLGWKLLVNQ